MDLRSRRAKIHRQTLRFAHHLAGRTIGEVVIVSQQPSAVSAYAENYLVEDEPLQTARRLATEFGAEPVTVPTGGVLRLLAASIGARAVVEVGTGCGVSGIWLLRGMDPAGALTTVDVEPEHQRMARRAYTEAGFIGGRARLISGRALDVLPRLTDGAYDLVFCDAARQEYPDYLTETLRLLRPGGLLAFDDALHSAEDSAGDAQRRPSGSGDGRAAVRELCRLVREDDDLVPALLPVGTGLLAAVKRPVS